MESTSNGSARQGFCQIHLIDKDSAKSYDTNSGFYVVAQYAGDSVVEDYKTTLKKRLDQKEDSHDSYILCIFGG
ncbi:MAG: hypothetical protein WA667_15550 [Candidatus Nitrosopolaris sp.]